jgi:hypothetical protein
MAHPQAGVAIAATFILDKRTGAGQHLSIPRLPAQHCNNLQGRRSVRDDLVRFIALFDGA